MAELNDKLITYGNLSTFYDKLQEQGLGGNAIEEVSELPNASENKNKLFRLDNGEKDVYAAKLLSSETTTTNRLPDEQQIDKAYIYETGVINYYKGAWKFIFNSSELEGYGWLGYWGNNEEWALWLTQSNAADISDSSKGLAIASDAPDLENIDFENHIATINSDFYNTWDDVDDLENNGVYPVPATYNAPESAQIGNAWLVDGADGWTGVYDGTQVTFIDTDGSGEEVTGYKWTIEGNDDYIATSKPASEIYFHKDSFIDDEQQTVYQYSTDVTVWVVAADATESERSAISQQNEESIYIPQLNAPDSEQVGHATISEDYFGGTNVYTGEEETIVVDGNTLTVYKWLNENYPQFPIYSTKRASEIYNTDKDSDDVHFYLDEEGDIGELTFDNSDLLSISTVKYQRTEVTEEWDWQPLTDNATNDDIDLMFAAPESPVVKRVLMKDSEDYGYSINEGWINFNDETMSYDGGTYYKWLKYSESRDGEAVEDGGGDYFILTDTLNPTLPFDVNSNECVYDFEIEDEGETYRMESDETYSKMALIHEDGSITYEE